MAINNIEDIEQAVLGAIILNPTSISRCNLQPINFNSDLHQEIYKALQELSSQNKPIDMFSVDIATKNKYTFELVKMTSRVSSAAHIEYHSAIIFESFIKRRLTQLCQSTIGALAQFGNDAFDVLQTLSKGIESFHISRSSEVKTLKSISTDVIGKIDEMQNSDKKVVGISTGYEVMDKNTNGLHATDLMIVAARPATGKTAFSLNLALNVAKQNIPILFFSLEMSAEQLVKRIISSETGIYSSVLQKGELSDYQWKLLIDSDFNAPMYIDDTAGLSLLDFKEKCRRMKKKHEIQVVFVDYLQLMSVYGKGTRENQISEISRGLKLIAKELKVCVIALAQLSRDVEKRGGKPKLSDLRESGGIEQDADIVCFLHNDEDINEQNPTIDIIYAKHRNGPVGEFNLKFDKSHQKFSSI